MNCENFQVAVSEIAREDIMDASEREQALRHADQCATCASHLEAQHSLSFGLRSFAASMNDLAAPADLETRLLGAFRERQKVQPTVVAFPTRRNLARQWLVAVAAALLIVIGVFVVRAVIFKAPPAQVVVLPSGTHEIAAPVISSSPEQLQPASADSKEARRHLLKSQNKLVRATRPQVSSPAAPANAAVAATSTAAATTEVATDFFPIGYNPTPNLQEGGQLLRVELSRAAVARFGLPVNMDRIGQRVKADVLVGADGVAQAIRFVQ
jgi:hypothetical protein